MAADTDPREYIRRFCEDFAAKVWNEALDRAAEEVNVADNYRDALVRILNMKISREGG